MNWPTRLMRSPGRPPLRSPHSLAPPNDPPNRRAMYRASELSMRLGSKIDPTRIAVWIQVFHVPGRSLCDILTKVAGDHFERHINTR